ncbi:MAG: hypothetical protein ACFE0P_10530 [Oceanicaulis sp.]
MKLVLAAGFIALAYLVELVALAAGLAGITGPGWSALSFLLLFAGAMLTFARARGEREERLKAHLDVSLVLTGIGVTIYAFALSVFFDVAGLAPAAAVALPVLAALSGIAAMGALARGLWLRLAVAPA